MIHSFIQPAYHDNCVSYIKGPAEAGAGAERRNKTMALPVLRRNDNSSVSDLPISNTAEKKETE